ncbi:MAG: phosphatase PAP2 family protein [Candidatus Polarisedimenticolia bacterium]
MRGFKRILMGCLLATVATAMPAWATGLTAFHDADVAVAWFDLLYDAIQTERLSPPVASRLIGYQGVALYESLVPGMYGRRQLTGQLNGLDGSGPRWVPGAHWPSVANAAMARMMRATFASASAPTLAAIDALEQEIEGRFARVPARFKALSVTHGRETADRILAWAATDGFATVNNCPYTPPVGEGLWEPTPPLSRPALQPCWGDLRPFVLTSGSECSPPPPPAFSTEIGSAFRAEAQEVYDVTTQMTDGQEAIALFWSDDPGNTGTPPGHWTSIVGQVAASRRFSLARAAEAYARVGLAVADAFIASWDAKYTHNLLRPVTYINDVIDPAWSPLLSTPPFPEYTSGHSTQSAAAAFQLTDMLGRLAFVDDTHEARGLRPRFFRSFGVAAREAAVSRLYGGIHYRAAIEKGLEQGECIGRAIRRRVQFSRN